MKAVTFHDKRDVRVDEVPDGEVDQIEAGGQAEYLRVPQAQFGPIKVVLEP